MLLLSAQSDKIRHIRVCKNLVEICVWSKDCDMMRFGRCWRRRHILNPVQKEGTTRRLGIANVSGSGTKMALVFITYTWDSSHSKDPFLQSKLHFGPFITQGGVFHVVNFSLFILTSPTQLAWKSSLKMKVITTYLQPIAFLHLSLL